MQDTTLRPFTIPFKWSKSCGGFIILQSNEDN